MKRLAIEGEGKHRGAAVAARGGMAWEGETKPND